MRRPTRLQDATLLGAEHFCETIHKGHRRDSAAAPQPSAQATRMLQPGQDKYRANCRGAHRHRAVAATCARDIPLCQRLSLASRWRAGPKGQAHGPAACPQFRPDRSLILMIWHATSKKCPVRGLSTIFGTNSPETLGCTPASEADSASENSFPRVSGPETRRYRA